MIEPKYYLYRIFQSQKRMQQVVYLFVLILTIFCTNNVNKFFFSYSRFEALVEREWLQAGHPFACRCAKSAFALTKKHYEAPVFLLFLDCVWQVTFKFRC